MKTIWKFQLPTAGRASFGMPKDSEILSLQVQQGVPCIWVLVDTELDHRTRRFSVYGTGHEILNDNHKFIGTYQVLGGDLVFHVFENLGE